MSRETNLRPIAAAIGTTFAVSLALSPIARASDNPFNMTELSSGYMVAGNDAEGKCGESKKEAEGKCGESKKEAEGKCGENKDTSAEGKCGEGKCGENRKAHEGKCGEDMKGEKAGEGKCGEGKKEESKEGEGKCGGST